jgi:RNA polymerase sigma-70 factor (ECF subfamily)
MSEATMASSPHSVTALLLDWSNGNKESLDKLIPVIYDELRRHAARQLRRERLGHTLQTTALIHEAYLRLVDQKNVRWQNRAHFFGIAANLMRQILVDHARKHNAAKRGGTDIKLSLDEAMLVSEGPDMDLLTLDEALTRLATIDPRKGRTVELRYFGGLSMEETAEVLEVSMSTAKHDWSMAKAWLRRELSRR